MRVQYQSKKKSPNATKGKFRAWIYHHTLAAWNVISSPKHILPVGLCSLILFVGLIPLVIIGAVSGFQQGKSTSIEREFNVSWLVVGIVYAGGMVMVGKRSMILVIVPGLVRDGVYAIIFFSYATLGSRLKFSHIHCYIFTSGCSNSHGTPMI